MIAPVPRESAPSDEKARVDILLVDDESRNLDVLESILTSPEYRLVRAQTAEQALMALIDGMFAVIVMDIQMPGTNGIELANLIKQRKRTQLIPIIFLTAYFQEDKDILQGYEVGAVDYLTKPVNPQILKSKIAVFVDLFQKARELAALNRAMETEIAQRQDAERALKESNNLLEARVLERTVELTRANDNLRVGERALRASEKRLTETLSYMPAGIFTCDNEARITFYNEAAAQLWGFAPEIGVSLRSDAFHLYRPNGVPLLFDQSPAGIALAEGRAVRGQEIVIERPDGTRRNALPHPEPIRDASGTVIGVINMLLDITGQKRAENAIQRLAAIIESSDDAIISENLNGIITSWNLGAERLFGYKPEEVVGRHISLLIPPDRQAEVPKVIEHISKGRHIAHYDTVRRCKDGSLMDISLTISPIRDSNGTIIGASKIARDITEKKRAEAGMLTLKRELEIQVKDLRQLHEMSRKLSNLGQLESMPREILNAALTVHGADMGMLSLCDPQRNGLRVIVSSGFNEEFLKMVEFIPPGSGSCGACFQTRSRVVIEDVERDPNFASYRKTAALGGFRAVHSTPLIIQLGRIIGVLSIHFREPHVPSEREIRLIDLYARQAAEGIESARLLTEISDARDAAEKANIAKDDFLAALSHELRTPLNPVLLLSSEAAQNPDLPADVRADFDTIARNVGLEARLIDDLLDLTRITRGKLALDLSFIDVHSVFKDALKTVQSEIKEKQISLQLDLQAAHKLIKGDAVRLTQIFWNVLKNAVKFTPKNGEITVKTRFLPESHEFVATVSDTGIGMTADELDLVFGAFSQGEHARSNISHRFGGLGLGLAISRKLVELHSGTIQAASKGRDQGSTFTIRLPLAQAPESSRTLQPAKPKVPIPRRPSPNRSADICVLLVEDHEPTRTALTHLLTRRHYRVETAGSLSEARALAGKMSFQLLISDIGLPDGKGYDLMSELGKTQNLKGIALTGYGMEHDVARSYSAGFAAHLTKPVRVQSLEAALTAAFIAESDLAGLKE